MPHFRLIIRGHWSPARDDYSGFFTNRSIKAENLNVASEKALTAVAAEWSSAPFLPEGGLGLKLAVLDGWKVSRLNAWRRASGGHSFFVTESEERDAANIEAQVARAPSDAVIWCIASPEGSSTSEFHALD